MRHSIGTKPMTFLIEDADACLVPRGADNVSLISSLLNLTDGIFGSMLDVRFIATTNASSIDFDPAITRPGRLCKHTYIDLLDSIKAGQVYARLTGGKEKKYSSKVSLATVYQDVNEGKNDYSSSQLKKNSVGF
jgi:ATP-dependent 26S proteasome regulatory subunit